MKYIKYLIETMLKDVQNYRTTKSNYKTELREMTSYFELLTRNFL